MEDPLPSIFGASLFLVPLPLGKSVFQSTPLRLCSYKQGRLANQQNPEILHL